MVSEAPLQAESPVCIWEILGKLCGSRLSDLRIFKLIRKYRKRFRSIEDPFWNWISGDSVRRGQQGAVHCGGAGWDDTCAVSQITPFLDLCSQ